MKKLLTLLLLMLAGSSAYAQIVDIVDVDESNHMFYAGVKGGISLSTMTQPDECNLYDSMGMGYHGGIMLQARFNRATDESAAGTGLLGVGLEAKYKLNSVKTTATDENGKANASLSLSYVDVPVFVRAYPFYKISAMNQFYLEAGPDFAFMLGRKPKTLTAGETSKVIYHLDDDRSTLKGMDMRVMVGLGYDFAIKNENYEATSLIGINARYYIGMNKLAGNFNSKMSSVEISLSYLFNIGKL